MPGLHFSKPIPVSIQSSDKLWASLKIYDFKLCTSELHQWLNKEKINSPYIFGDEVTSNFNVIPSDDPCISWNDRIEPGEEEKKTFSIKGKAILGNMKNADMSKQINKL